MGELFEAFPKLPKNIRQIGERDDVAKVYVEDYVSTYLRRLYPVPSQGLRVGLLLGNVEMREGIPYIFIDGAMEMEGVMVEGDKISFTEQIWTKAYEEIEQYFPKLTVQGWFICGGPGVLLSPLSYWKQHGEYFPGKYKVMYLSHNYEQDESLYITSVDGFYKLLGFCIYYERNQYMQDYMVQQNDTKRSEPEKDETPSRSYHRPTDLKKTVVGKKKPSVQLMYGVCGFLSVLAIAGGVTMINNYEKMRAMEVSLTNFQNVIAQKESKGGQLGESVSSTNGEDLDNSIVVETVSGGVFPTKSPESESVASTSKPAGSMESEKEPTTSGSETQGNNSESGTKSTDETKSAATTKTADEASQKESDPAEDKPAGALAAAGGKHVVKEGETLYSISLDFYKTSTMVEKICELNGIDNADSIFPGQELKMP